MATAKPNLTCATGARLEQRLDRREAFLGVLSPPHLLPSLLHMRLASLLGRQGEKLDLDRGLCPLCSTSWVLAGALGPLCCLHLLKGTCPRPSSRPLTPSEPMGTQKRDKSGSGFLEDQGLHCSPLSAREDTLPAGASVSRLLQLPEDSGAGGWGPRPLPHAPPRCCDLSLQAHLVRKVKARDLLDPSSLAAWQQTLPCLHQAALPSPGEPGQASWVDSVLPGAAPSLPTSCAFSEWLSRVPA